MHANILYGYDATDFMLNEMLSQPYCEWIMFTNGDNFYNKAWFSTVVPATYSPKNAVKIIGWDFVTHHLRDGQSNSVVRVKIERKFVDLGSVMIRALAFRIGSSNRIDNKSKLSHKNNKEYRQFLPDAVNTTDLFARDFHLIQQIYRQLSPDQIHLIHSCLLFHQ
jgi:hypothetical protein